MNWDAITAISDTVSTLAVVGSVIYLAVQIRQSNKISHSHTRTEMRHFGQEALRLIIEQPILIESYFKPELAVEERIRLQNYLMSCMRFREYVWRQYNEGLIEKQTFEDYLRVITYELGTERNRRWWTSAKRFGFNQGFIDFVDGKLKDSPLIDVEKQLFEW